ncbi:MAG: hypothetical protein QNL33_12285 [Akkermansiaceae bacterium]
MLLFSRLPSRLGEKIPAAEDAKGIILLKSGWHPIRLFYRHKDGKPLLNFTLNGPDGKSIILDSSNLLTAAPKN